MKFAVLLVAKTIALLLKMTGRSATALPGLVAERLYPRLLSDMLGDLPQGVVVVTGTNGKTTTTKILCELLESQGLRVVSNPSGSNFTRGVFSALIRQGSITGKLEYDIGVFELDEAYSRLLARQVKLRMTVVLNVLRDQLDRYGEIDTTAKHIAETLSHSGDAVLNADDPPVAALASNVDHLAQVSYFGVAPGLRQFLPSDDEMHGSTNPLHHPPQTLAVQLTKARMGGGEEKIHFVHDGVDYQAHFPLEGVHNAQNAVAALTAATALLPKSKVTSLASALTRIHPAFGRGERVEIAGRNVHIALVKNPGGFRQNLRAFVRREMRTILILINDNYADGRDVSWLWDVDFSDLAEHGASIRVGGIRGYDMALRLQYDDIPVQSIDESISAALSSAIRDGQTGDVLIFPTYTAMLETRKILEKETDLDGVWGDD